MKADRDKEAWSFDGTLQDPAEVISITRNNLSGRADSEGDMESQSDRSTVQLYWRFLCAAITRVSQTGAILPSQRFLVDRMIAPVPRDYRGEVVELGAGTGVLTLRLAERCPQVSILVCEINPELARDLEARVSAAGLSRRVRICTDPAERLLTRLEQWGSKPPEFVLSGIPLGNLAKERAAALVATIHQAMSQDGLYVQFQYSLMDRQKVRRRFSHLRTGFVLMNIPPAFVYYARK